MYTTLNFMSKAALKQAVKEGIPVTYFQPGLGNTPLDGTIYVEGPHYPKPHKWYAECTVKNGVIVKVK
jgi:hypothetical protein